jgi:hypothetical protein
MFHRQRRHAVDDPPYKSGDAGLIVIKDPSNIVVEFARAIASAVEVIDELMTRKWSDSDAEGDRRLPTERPALGLLFNYLELIEAGWRRARGHRGTALRSTAA